MESAHGAFRTTLELFGTGVQLMRQNLSETIQGRARAKSTGGFQNGFGTAQVLSRVTPRGGLASLRLLRSEAFGSARVSLGDRRNSTGKSSCFGGAGRNNSASARRRISASFLNWVRLGWPLSSAQSETVAAETFSFEATSARESPDWSIAQASTEGVMAMSRARIGVSSNATSLSGGSP